MIQLSAIDLWHICEELKETLRDAKLDQIYQYNPQTLLLRFHKSGVGKKEIHIHVPRSLFLTAKKPPVAKHLSFCSYLRKTIKGAYLTDMGLLGFSRTLYFTFTFKEQSYRLICEFYDKGNIILSSQNEKGEYIIDLPSQMQQWSSRTIKKGETYELDTTPFPHEVTQEQFDAFVDEAKDKIPISKFLATKLKLGGFYGKHVLSQLDITDEDSLEKLSFAKVQPILAKLFERTDKSKGFAYLKDTEDLKTTTHISPFLVDEAKTHVSAPTISELLDKYYAQEESAEYEDAKTLAFDKKVQKLTKILDSQKKTAQKLEKQITKNQDAAIALQEKSYEADALLKDYNNNKKDERIKTELKKEKKIIIEL